MAHSYQRQTMVVELADSWFYSARRRAQVLRHAGVVAEPSARVGRGVVVQGLGTVTLGSECIVHNDVYFDVVVDITIADGAVLGEAVRILTSSHEMGTSAQRAGELTSHPVVIGARCVIGPRTVVMPGVTIGDGTVVDADSLVTKDCEPGARYAGSPARRVTT